MTLPPERIGDKGQRYEVRASGFLDRSPEERAIAWAPTLEGAEQMAVSFNLKPGTVARVVDRGEIPAPPFSIPEKPVRIS
jgi:hypothetical protein